MVMKLGEIAKKINGILVGDENLDINGVNSLSSASHEEISFLSNKKYLSLINTTKAAAVLVPKDFNLNVSISLIKVDSPDRIFSDIALLFYKKPPIEFFGVHPSVVLSNNVNLGKNVSIGPNCTINGSVSIGNDTVIESNVVIGFGSKIGSNTHLYPSVSIREYTEIGNNVTIHNGSVIGADGFGYSFESDGTRKKIAQIGVVIIEDDVEIGANVTIDRARFGKTIVGSGTKIDNLVQIAHNVEIGNNSILCGQVGIAGSSKIGSNTILAGQVGVTGHLEVGDNVIANAQSGITRDIPSGEHVMGMPAVNYIKYNKGYAGMFKLDKLRNKIRSLEKLVKKLGIK